MNTNQPAQPVTNTRKPRFGLFKLKIGSVHVMRCPDGIKRQYTARDKSRHPKANSVAVCLFCKQTWPTESELLAAHPETRIMVKQEEAHVYGWWSDEPTEPVAAKPEKANGSATQKDKDYSKILGLLSDEELGQP